MSKGERARHMANTFLTAALPLVLTAGCAGAAGESGSLDGPSAVTSTLISVPRSVRTSATDPRSPDEATPATTPSARISAIQAPPTDGFVKLTGAGVPALAARAYLNASQRSTEQLCTVPAEVLAAIGAAESRHGAIGSFDEDGTSREPIKGYATTGKDTDGGTLDGDAEQDFAVGPMQFTPETWTDLGHDGDGDGDSDPHSFYDSALAAAAYICRLAGPLRPARFIVGQWDQWESQNRQLRKRVEVLHANWEKRKAERSELERYVNENPDDFTNAAVLARLAPLEPEPVYEEPPPPAALVQLRTGVERYYGPEGKVRDEYRDNVESIFRRLVSTTGGVETTQADRLS